MPSWTRMSRFALAAAAGVTCMVVSDSWSSLKQHELTTQANARIGRPLTPMSVAGVARRTTRRHAYYGAAAAGAAAYGTAAYYNRNGCACGPRGCACR